ncbi:MAG: molybdopterin-guanine dinucleotide biosynthesis protein B [Eggerthellaceae bacterium]
MPDRSFNSPSVPAIAFVGVSGSGKTTLAEKVIERLTAKGYRVGAVKHHGHRGFDIDIEGKDSWRMTQAGAQHTVLVSPDRIAAYRSLPEGEEPPIEAVVQTMHDVDVVVVEGYKHSGIPSIELHRAANCRQGDPSPLLNPGRAIAVVTDIPSLQADADKRGLPVFAFDDVEGVVTFIEERVIR